jgi:hypothetical protein
MFAAIDFIFHLALTLVHTVVGLVGDVIGLFVKLL